MAEIWGAAIAVGGSLIGGAMSSSAAGSAAQDQENEANASNQIQQQEHNQTVANLSPYNTAGTNALNTMNQLNSGNYSSFTQSPDYQFALQQGTQALDSSAAARGTLFSGGYGKTLEQYGQGLASQNYNSYYNHLSGVAGLGENAAAQVGNANSSYANAVNANNTNSGQAAAQGALGQSSAYNNTLNQLSQAYGQYKSTYGTNANADDEPYNALNSGYQTGMSAYSGLNNGTFNSNAYAGLGS